MDFGSTSSVIKAPAPDETEQPILIPKSYASKFVALKHMSVRAFVPVQKRNDAGRLQHRVIVVTDGLVFLASPEGDIKRSFPLSMLGEVFCNPQHGLVVMIVPGFYDLAVFVDVPQTVTVDDDLPAGSPLSPPKRKSSALKGIFPWSKPSKPQKKGGAPTSTKLSDILGEEDRPTPQEEPAPEPKPVMNADDLTRQVSESAFSGQIQKSSSAFDPSPASPLHHKTRDEKLPPLALALRTAYNALPGLRDPLRVTTILDYDLEGSTPDFTLKKPPGFVALNYALCMEYPTQHKLKGHFARRSVFNNNSFGSIQEAVAYPDRNGGDSSKKTPEPDPGEEEPDEFDEQLTRLRRYYAKYCPEKHEAVIYEIATKASKDPDGFEGLWAMLTERYGPEHGARRKTIKEPPLDQTQVQRLRAFYAVHSPQKTEADVIANVRLYSQHPGGFQEMWHVLTEKYSPERPAQADTAKPSPEESRSVSLETLQSTYSADTIKEFRRDQSRENPIQATDADGHRVYNALQTSGMFSENGSLASAPEPKQKETATHSQRRVTIVGPGVGADVFSKPAETHHTPSDASHRSAGVSIEKKESDILRGKLESALDMHAQSVDELHTTLGMYHELEEESTKVNQKHKEATMEIETLKAKLRQIEQERQAEKAANMQTPSTTVEQPPLAQPAPTTSDTEAPPQQQQNMSISWGSPTILTATVTESQPVEAPSQKKPNGDDNTSLVGASASLWGSTNQDTVSSAAMEAAVAASAPLCDRKDLLKTRADVLKGSPPQITSVSEVHSPSPHGASMRPVSVADASTLVNIEHQPLVAPPVHHLDLSDADRLALQEEVVAARREAEWHAGQSDILREENALLKKRMHEMLVEVEWLRGRFLHTPTKNNHSLDSSSTPHSHSRGGVNNDMVSRSAFVTPQSAPSPRREQPSWGPRPYGELV